MIGAKLRSGGGGSPPAHGAGEPSPEPEPREGGDARLRNAARRKEGRETLAEHAAQTDPVNVYADPRRADRLDDRDATWRPGALDDSGKSGTSDDPDPIHDDPVALSAFSSTAAWFMSSDETRERAREESDATQRAREWSARQERGWGFGPGKPGDTIGDAGNTEAGVRNPVTGRELWDPTNVNIEVPEIEVPDLELPAWLGPAGLLAGLLVVVTVLGWVFRPLLQIGANTTGS